MPELPEVETVCRGLSPVMSGRVITLVKQHRPDLRIPFPENFVETLQGARVEDVIRRAKYLLIALDNKQVLVAHLGMSGKIVVHESFRNEEHKHDHVVFQLDDGKEIVFNDPRRFGLMTIMKSDEVLTHPLFVHLGPEPLEADFTASYLQHVFKDKKVPVKTAIMDNRVVVGVGNIYACESLFRARINPLRAAGTLALAELEKLVVDIKQVLEEAIISGGSTLRDYVRSSGDAGYFQHHFAVYDKEGKACGVCDTVIARVKQGGRSTFYCPGCQGEKESVVEREREVV